MRKKIIVTLLVLFITYYISQNFCQFNLIQGESMYPTYKNMQLTLINRRATSFQRGDVIVFYCPSLDCTMVKRIIAVPNDRILVSNGSVLVNGTQSPFVHDYVTYGGIASDEIFLENGQFFVMGDNHPLSKDSRYKEVGCVSRENIIGRLIPNRPPVSK